MRVVVGEPSLLVRAGLARLVEDAGMDVVGEAGDPLTLLRKVRGHRPDVAVADAGMAGMIRGQLEGVRLLLLADHADASHLTGLAGAGYLLKSRIAEPERLTHAIREVARGGSVLDPEVVGNMLTRRRGDPIASLTGRERDVLERMAAGESNRGIAGGLFLSERAVERHITAIFTKLGVRSNEGAHRRVLAVLAYLRAV
ncbi:response regulator transcription factor [Solirubrobacter soli]|uniref:response regulator transcription factor n=1 Tax=Solirubrobacter soli TaxID=363832 RepID=UPI000482F711|nr:response regulator transcription factor [Solirubrobacter soli]